MAENQNDDAIPVSSDASRNHINGHEGIERQIQNDDDGSRSACYNASTIQLHSSIPESIPSRMSLSTGNHTIPMENHFSSKLTKLSSNAYATVAPFYFDCVPIDLPSLAPGEIGHEAMLRSMYSQPSDLRCTPNQRGFKSSPTTNVLTTPQTRATVVISSTEAPVKGTPAGLAKASAQEVTSSLDPEAQSFLPLSLFDYSYDDILGVLDSTAPFTVLDLKDEDATWALRDASSTDSPDSSAKNTPSTRQSDISENDNSHINLEIKMDMDVPELWMAALQGVGCQPSEDLQNLGVTLPPMNNDDMMLFYGDNYMMDLDSMDSKMMETLGTLDPSLLGTNCISPDERVNEAVVHQAEQQNKDLEHGENSSGKVVLGGKDEHACKDNSTCCDEASKNCEYHKKDRLIRYNTKALQKDKAQNDLPATTVQPKHEGADRRDLLLGWLGDTSQQSYPIGQKDLAPNYSNSADYDSFHSEKTEEESSSDALFELEWWSESSMSTPNSSSSPPFQSGHIEEAALALFAAFRKWRSTAGDGKENGQREKHSTSEANKAFEIMSSATSPSGSSNIHRNPRKRDREEEDDRRSSQKRRLNPSDEVSDTRLLACPYVKNRPLQHRKCFKYMLLEIGRLKQHLMRVHKIPIHCAKCSAIFVTEEDRDTHLRQQPECPLRPPRAWDGVSDTQRKQLSKRVSSKKSREENWYLIYEILFPDSSKPESPYLEDPEISEDLLALREFAAHEAPAHIRQFIQSELPSDLRPNLPQVERFTQIAVRHVFDLLLQTWESTRASSQDSSELSPNRAMDTSPTQSIDTRPDSAYQSGSSAVAGGTPPLPSQTTPEAENGSSSAPQEVTSQQPNEVMLGDLVLEDLMGLDWANLPPLDGFDSTEPFA